jgi:nucleotide-binding universal stress UspA family protein
MFRHILIPTDGSELSDKAVAAAMQFAKEINASVTGFYASPGYPIPMYYEGWVPLDPEDDSTPEKFEDAARERAQRVLGAFEAKAKEFGVPCATHTLSSYSPWEAIIQAANEKGCDLIFMASHGRRGLGAVLMGSETTRVLTHCKIPVLVYR